MHLPQKTSAALLGVIPPGGINDQQGDLLFFQIGKGGYPLQIRIQVGVGLQVGANQVIALHIDICPTVANNILQIAEHLVGDLLHLVQAFFIDKIFDIGPAQDKEARDCRKAGEDAGQQDAAVFFKNMSIGNLDGTYKNLIVSPTSLKQKVLALMDEEIQRGEQGRIVMKMNSVTDMDFIRKVAEASRAGVKVDLIVRGICCILPGIAQETENLTVTSIVGRYLEHPRVFVFGTGAEQKVYIGSADMMTRNTEKRVEVACPILNEEIKKRLVRNLHVMLADNVKARAMTSDGTYRKKKVEGKAINSQEIFMKEALMAKRVEKKPQKQTFLQKMRRLFQKE